MVNVLFVCHGNICRSPMAQFVLQYFVEKMDLADSFSKIRSAATSTEEIGNTVYPPIAKILDRLDIDYKNKKARQITKSDCREYDYIIVMDDNNLRNLFYLHSDIDKSKVSKLLDYTENPMDVDDPWYTRDFERTFEEIKQGCVGFLKMLKQKGIIEYDENLLDKISDKI